MDTTIGIPDGRNDGSWTPNVNVPLGDPPSIDSTPKLPVAAKGPDASSGSGTVLSPREAVQGPARLGKLPMIERCRPSGDEIVATRWFLAMKPRLNDRQAPPSNPAITNPPPSEGATEWRANPPARQ